MKKSHFLVLAALSSPAISHAAVVYTTDFSDATVGNNNPVGWVEPAGTALSTITADHKYQLATSNNSAVGLTPVSGLSTATGEGFKVTTQFTLSDGTGQYENSGIVFLSTSDFASNYRIVYNLGSGNGSSLEFQNTGDAFASSSNGTLADPGDSATYTLTLTGIYLSGGALQLTATLSNSANANTATSTATTDATPLTGGYYGIRTASGGSPAGAITGVYSSYTVESIPEPSALILSAASLGLFLRKKRG